ncbi:hypothetical protein EVA_19797 [gut metagenome]|uniref:Uncharacterized protein n=1 Tax=gut metagenome TaxID=749906 RepID=J9FB36_9ZZZZ
MKMKKNGKHLVIRVQTKYREGHPKEGKDAGFLHEIATGMKVHFIHEGNTEIEKLYTKLAKHKKGKRTAVLPVTYVDEAGNEILHREFIRIQKITICYDPLNFKKYDTLEGHKIPICHIQVDDREIHNADNVSDNSGLSRQDFNDWFFKSRRAVDYFEGYVLHFTKAFNY